MTSAEVLQLAESLRQYNRGEAPRLIQTHISFVLLGEEAVWKIKKPVKFSFLDFSTVEKRTAVLNQELVLNRRLAKPVYSQIHNVTMDEEGIRLNGAGEVIDHALQMQRLPRERHWDMMLAAGTLDESHLETLAQTLAAFYKKARRPKPEEGFGSLEHIAEVIGGNFEALLGPEGEYLDQRLLVKMQETALDFMVNRKSLLLDRQATWVVEGHGDLRLEHICQGPLFGSPVLVYDCIEFGDRLRHLDVASDVAFLAMELMAFGRDDLAASFLRRLAAATGDEGIWALQPFYQCYRALVRAKVETLSSCQDVSAKEREGCRTRARGFVDLASRFLLTPKPTLIMTHGFSGTGKSTLARSLQPLVGAVMRSSDVVRKKLLDIPPTEHRLSEPVEAELYSLKHTRRTYETICDEASWWLEHGSNVILDATSLKKWQRDLAAETAAKADAAFVILSVESTSDEAVRRIEERNARGEDPSDATPSVYHRQQKEAEPLTAEEKAQTTVVGTDGTVQDAIQLVVEKLRQRLL